ncbi:MAG: DUF4956 domain-containing protein [Corynebacterium sp.]|nr:DUF4956 domain-containing protein [Corynebacterium sp.]
MSYVLTLLDIVAISVLVFCVYLPRYRRTDLAFALLGLNVGVHVVSLALVSAEASASIGFGLGLFGVLSIIRLRSSEISQREMAFYVASLAIALITGGAASTTNAAILLVILIGVCAMSEWLPLLQPTSQIEVHFDRAISDQIELKAHAEALLGVDVLNVVPIRIDQANDLTYALITVRRSHVRQATLVPA